MIKFVRSVVLVAAISLALFEVALRVYNPIYLPLRADGIVLPVNRTFVQTNLNNKDVDRKLVNSYNEIGMRGPSYPDQPEKFTKIFTVGGSTTACVTLTDGKTWPDLVLKRLRAQFGANVWLNNAGIDGHSTFGHRILLESHLAKYRPDYVVYLIGINDMGRDDLNEYDAGMTLEGQSLRNRVIAASEFLSTVQALYRAYRAFDMGLNHAVDHDLRKIQSVSLQPTQIEGYLRDQRERYLPAYANRVRALVERTLAVGAVPVLVTQPGMVGRGVDPVSGVTIDNLEYDIPGLSAAVVWDALELYNDVTRSVAAQYRVPLIDAAREMPKDSSLYFDWIHYSNAGAARMSEIVSRELAAVLDARSAPR
jgi:lysophospholipase L1-like esterase